MPAYAELAVSSSAVANITVGTQCTYPQRDGQVKYIRHPKN